MIWFITGGAISGDFISYKLFSMLTIVYIFACDINNKGKNKAYLRSSNTCKYNFNVIVFF